MYPFTHQASISPTVTPYPMLTQTASQAHVTRENEKPTHPEKHSLFLVTLVEVVSKLLIERIFFQNTYIPTDLVLTVVNQLIQSVDSNPKQKRNVYKDAVIGSKQWLGWKLTAEEQDYEQADKELDYAGVLASIQNFTASLMDYHLFFSVTSAQNQELEEHLPMIYAYQAALMLGPMALNWVIKKLAHKPLSHFSAAQRAIVEPWLAMVGRLLLAFLPKVSANAHGVHYQYPSVAGHTQTVTSAHSFQVHRFQEITSEKIKLEVMNQQGEKIPIEFEVKQTEQGREMTVNSPDKFVEAFLIKSFQPQLEETVSSLNMTDIPSNTTTVTPVQITPASLSREPIDLTCPSALLISTVASAVGHNALPTVLAGLSCLSKLPVAKADELQKFAQSSTGKRHSEQSSQPSLNVVNLPLDSQFKDMVIENGYAYTVNGQAGLKILDVSNPNNITHISQYDTLGDAQRIVVDKGYAYIADGDRGLQIINVKNVTNPVFAGMWMTHNPINDVAVINNKAYIADGTDVLREIDIRSPERVYRAVFSLSFPQAVAASGKFAYVTDLDIGCHIMDMSDAANPQWRSTTFPAYAPYGVAVSGNIAYLADAGFDTKSGHFAGLYIIDVSNATNPQLRSNLGTFGAGYDVAVSENFAYVVGPSSFYVIDVSNATNPQLRGTLGAAGWYVAVSGNIAYVRGIGSPRMINVSNAMNPYFLDTNTTIVSDVAVSGNVAYVVGVIGGVAGFHVIDMSNATNPQLLGTLNGTSGGDVAVSGDFACVVSSRGLYVIDVSNATNPQLRGMLAMTNAQRVAVSENFAYVVSRLSALHIIDVRSLMPENIYFFRDRINKLLKVGSELWVLQSSGFQKFNPAVPLIFTEFLTTPGYDVAVSGSVAYVADLSSSLHIIDVNNTTNPQLRGTFNTTNAQGVVVSENVAYVVGTTDFRIIDVSDATNPQLLGTLNMTNARDVAVSEKVAYVVDYTSGLHIIDVSDATDPQLLGTLATTWAQAVAALGNFTYVMDSTGFRIIDVSNATNPQLRGTLATTSARDVAVSGNVAYVVGSGGLYVIDVSNATNPQLRGTFHTSNAQGVAVSRNYVYVADGYSGLRIIDVSNATNPFLLYQFKTLGFAYRVAVAGNKVCVATNAGLTIFDMTVLPWLPFIAYSSPQILLIAQNYAFIANNDTLSIWNISDPAQAQYVGSLNTPSVTHYIDFINPQLLLGNDQGMMIVDISDPTLPTLVSNISCRLPVKSFSVNQGILSLPAAYQCQYQPAPAPQPLSDLMPAPQPLNGLTSCPAGQPLTLRSNDIQMSKGQNLRLTPNDLSAHCGNHASPHLDTVFTVVGIRHSEFKLRNASGFWNNASRFLGKDLSQANVAMIHDNSTLAPEFNFTFTDGQTTFPETVANIRFNVNGSSSTIQITLSAFDIQFNGTTVLTPQSLQITVSGEKIDNLVISTGSVQGGYFALGGNLSHSIEDFSYYQVKEGQIQFVHNGIALPNMTLSVSDGTGQKVLLSPLVNFFQTTSPNKPSVNVEAAVGASVGVVAVALTTCGIFCYRKYRHDRRTEETMRGIQERVAKSASI